MSGETLLQQIMQDEFIHPQESQQERRFKTAEFNIFTNSELMIMSMEVDKDSIL